MLISISLVTWKVTHKNTGAPFAAKTLRKKYANPSAIRAMIDEIKLLAQVIFAKEIHIFS